jgi:twitching motility protein PilT
MQLQQLLTELLERGGSDMHLVAGQPAVFRVDGALVRQEGAPLDEATLNRLLLTALAPDDPNAGRAILDQRRDMETLLRQEGRVFRLHVFQERGRLAATLRTIPQEPPTLDELYHETRFRYLLESLIKQPRGVIVVTGPSGSGKTTTCMAMLEAINRTAAARIITLEDPISFEMTSKQSLITQRSIGQDVPTYESGAYWAFHQDADVIFIEEMRNLDTVQYAFALAEAGCLVLTQLHVESASEAVRRLIDVFPEPRDLIRRMMARNLVAVIAQRLLPRADRPGRVAANEALVVTQRTRQLLLEGPTDLTTALVMEASRHVGMQTMDDSLVELYRDNMISYETAWLHISDRERLGPFARRAGEGNRQ